MAQPHLLRVAPSGAAPPAAARPAGRGRLHRPGGARGGGAVRRVTVARTPCAAHCSRWTRPAPASCCGRPPGRRGTRWLAALRAALPAATALRRVPLNDARTTGCSAAWTWPPRWPPGARCVARGLLAEAEGGVLLLAMAERLPAGHGGAARGRFGCWGRASAWWRWTRGWTPMQPPAGLLDRLAFPLVLDAAPGEDEAGGRRRGARPAARRECRRRASGGAVQHGGGAGRRTRCARRSWPCAPPAPPPPSPADSWCRREDAALAARLVLAPRATRLPEPDRPIRSGGGAGAAERPRPSRTRARRATPRTRRAAAGPRAGGRPAAIPAGLLAQLQEQAAGAAGPGPPGASGALHRSGQRGRPAGVRPGDPRRGLRLNLIETLRAAAPWQAVRRGRRASSGWRSVRPTSASPT